VLNDMIVEAYENVFSDEDSDEDDDDGDVDWCRLRVLRLQRAQ
jgi:hypothetical protein